MAGLTLRNDAVSHMPAAPADWQTVLAASVRSPAELCRLVGLPPAVAAEAEGAAAGFPVLVPRPYLDRIRRGDPDDPLLRQVLPRAAELAETPGYSTDPLHEADAAVCPGLLSKYHGRSLMVATAACAVHCRFCFRRHFRYSDSVEAAAATVGAAVVLPPPAADGRGGSTTATPTVDFSLVLQRIAAEESLDEVVLSGGDPLVLPDRELAGLAHRLAAIPHLKRLRIHTRMPVVIPQRVTDDLLGWLRATRLTLIVVVHVNHPAEIDGAVAAALGRLVDAGVPVLSQAVLLRGVNDRADLLEALYRRLVDLRVMPYYLHQLDLVAGAAHFAVPEATGIALIAQLRARLPGYAVPRYVRETPGADNKEVLA
jgi:L-lysine 2,3-aminomutase